MAELIYPELSYKIVGILFEVDNKLGYGLRESSYEKVVENLLIENKINFKKQLKCAFKINNKLIRYYYLDFLIEDKIVLELKAQRRINKENVSQVYDYLKINKLRLGILANFTKNGVIFKRIICKND